MRWYTRLGLFLCFLATTLFCDWCWGFPKWIFYRWESEGQPSIAVYPWQDDGYAWGGWHANLVPTTLLWAVIPALLGCAVVQSIGEELKARKHPRDETGAPPMPAAVARAGRIYRYLWPTLGGLAVIILFGWWQQHCRQCLSGGYWGLETAEYVDYMVPMAALSLVCLAGWLAQARRLRRMAASLTTAAAMYSAFYWLALWIGPENRWQWTCFDYGTAGPPLQFQINQWIVVGLAALTGGAVLGWKLRRQRATARARAAAAQPTAWEAAAAGVGDGWLPPLPAFPGANPIFRSKMLAWQIAAALPFVFSLIVIVAKMRVYESLWNADFYVPMPLLLLGLQLGLAIALFSPFATARLLAAAASVLTAGFLALVWIHWIHVFLESFTAFKGPVVDQYNLRLFVCVALLPFAWHLLKLEAAQVRVIPRPRLRADQVETGIEDGGDWDRAPRAPQEPIA